MYWQRYFINDFLLASLQLISVHCLFEAYTKYDEYIYIRVRYWLLSDKITSVNIIIMLRKHFSSIVKVTTDFWIIKDIMTLTKYIL